MTEKLKPVNTIEDKCTNRCNLYPTCPCGAYDAKHGIVDQKKADGCITKGIAAMLLIGIVAGLYYLVMAAIG